MYLLCSVSNISAVEKTLLFLSGKMRCILCVNYRLLTQLLQGTQNVARKGQVLPYLVSHEVGTVISLQKIDYNV